MNTYPPITKNSAPPLILSAFLLLGWVSPCLAERTDHDKPVNLNADQVLIDDVQQISTFSGNVQLTQGTLLIRADKIVITQDKDGFKLGVAYGNPASFRQKREGMDEYVEGYGERIEYDTGAKTVDFHTQARIKRNHDEVRGEHITYSAKTEVLRVNGGGSGGNTQRVRAVLYPKSKTGTTSRPESLPIKPSDTLTPENRP